MRRIALIAIIFAFALVLLSFSSLGPASKDALSRAFAPLNRNLLHFGHTTRNFFETLSHIGALSRRNKELETDNQQLQAELLALKEVQHDNMVLKEALNISNRPVNLQPARIIGRAGVNLLASATIDRGTSDGVARGQAVTANGFFIGIVVEARAHTADVEFVTSPSAAIPALIADSREPGLVRGKINQVFLDDIPITAKAANGAAVVTSGLGGDLPAGLPIGTITEVTERPGDIFHTITIAIPVRLRTVEIVFVVKQ